MATLAIYNSKGGVGKTTFAINLAWEAAASGHRTLLWEIDGQGDSSWLMLEQGCAVKVNAASFMHGFVDPLKQVCRTKIDGLDILSGDSDNRRTDNFFREFAREHQLQRLFVKLKTRYDLIILDCPPGFGEASQKIILNADLVVVPVIPSPLAMRGVEKITKFATQYRGPRPPLLPVFSMADRRRSLHKASLAENPDWPVVPMSSEIERQTKRRQPLGHYAPNCAASQTFRTLWNGIERKLRTMSLIRTVIQTPAVPLPVAQPQMHAMALH
jgi:chromosome partitioning protein